MKFDVFNESKMRQSFSNPTAKLLEMSNGLKAD